MKRCAALLFALLIPTPVFATTAKNLSPRMTVDGSLQDFSADEWIVDATSSFPERPGDSAWGRLADISRVALTWDESYIYVGVDAVISDAAIAVWMQWGNDGLRSLEGLGTLGRLVELPAIRPNLYVLAGPGVEARVLRAGGNRGTGLVDEHVVPRRFARAANGRAGLECAIAWNEMPPGVRTVRLVVAITGPIGRDATVPESAADGKGRGESDASGPVLPRGFGYAPAPGEATATGAGDAVPDPSARLSSSRFERAWLDRAFEVTVDADADGRPDFGISPREATVVTGPPGRGAVPGRTKLSVTASPRTFSPDAGEHAVFRISSNARDALSVFVTITLHSISGRRVRVLARDQRRIVPPGNNAPVAGDEWDGRGDDGHVVDGGMYVLNVTWGAVAGRIDGSARVVLVVVR